MQEPTISRRSALGALTTGVLSAAAGAPQTLASESSAKLKGNIKQSVSKWCFDKFIAQNSYDEFAKRCAEMGLAGIDLIDYKEWPTAQKYGLIPTMTSGAGNISNALNVKDNHAKCLEEFKTNIPRAAENKVPNVITFSGNRRGMGDEEGWENCALGLKEAVKIAEDKGVIICMELLNSKVDHKDYMCDHAEWGVELCKRVNSPNFKLLYDIYHMQIMEGDIIRTIKKNIQHFGHFHTGGNPGRLDIDETQELFYPAIMRAIVEAGYQGYVAHEFIPKNGLDSLAAAIKLCDV